jgi:outer membrane protein OmpA-like peptidoglycan-associated protein
MAAVDSVQVQRLTTKYHNNRTPSQAEAVKQGLVKEGVAENRIKVVGYKDEEPPLPFDLNQDRVVVVKFLNGL